MQRRQAVDVIVVIIDLKCCFHISAQLDKRPCLKQKFTQCDVIIARYYKTAELEQLFEATKSHPLSLLIQMTAFYGLRRSEVLGIKWDAIDLERNTITIYIRSQKRKKTVRGSWLPKTAPRPNRLSALSRW